MNNLFSDSIVERQYADVVARLLVAGHLLELANEHDLERRIDSYEDAMRAFAEFDYEDKVRNSEDIVRYNRIYINRKFCLEARKIRTAR